MVEFLEREDIPFVIVGGLANAVWGEPRATRDIDVKVFIGELTAEEFTSLVARRFPVVSRPIPLIVTAKTPEGITVDFLIAVPGYEEQILARARRVVLGSMEIPVCSPEDLIIQKAIADRDRDWADIEGILIEQWGHLDQAYIRHWLTQFAEVLERPDWLERYEALVQRVSSYGGEGGV